MEIIQFDEMKKTWHRIARNHSGNIPPSFELEVYKKMFDIFHVGDFYYYVANIAQVNIEFVGGKIQNILGIAPDEFSIQYIFDNIHPEDKDRFIAYEQKVTEFFNRLPPDKIMKYKPSYDYRLRCADGSYRWILIQTVTIQSDEDDSVIRLLGVHTDITCLKTNDKGSGLSFLELEGEPSYHNVRIKETSPILISSDNLFSRREQQILHLILVGRNSSEIAEVQAISKHTVNNHRKRIFTKSGCKTLVELGAKAIKKGWL